MGVTAQSRRMDTAYLEESRKQALALLKPSKKALEHGMALHRDALVVEPYCLGVTYDMGPAKINEWIEEGLNGEEVVSRYLEASRLLVLGRSEHARQSIRAAWEASGVTAVFQNAGEECNIPTVLLQRLATHTGIVDMLPDQLCRVTKPEDIQLAKETKRGGIGFALNGVPLAGNQRSVHDELSLVSVFARLGVRIAHLTYNRRNLLADGCGEAEDGGLSDFGRHAIHELTRCGIMVDVAHSGWRSTREAAEEAKVPVVISHSAACALHETIRGKPDDVIRAVVDRGGVMGITNVPGFLGRSGDIHAFLDHIEYVIKNFGEDAVAIGTDKGHVCPSDQKTDDIVGLPLPPGRRNWESLWPSDKPSTIKVSIEAQNSLRWSNWPLFTVGLVERGYSDETIRKVIGGNFMRVFQTVWEQSDYCRRD